jgi:signal transduction histidine kinase
MQKENIELISFVAFTTLFVLLLVLAAIMLFRIYLKRKNSLLKEKERMSIEFEQTLLRSRLEIQDQTFSYIGKEIHDNIGQVLSLVRINLNTLNPSLDEQKISLMDELMEKAITDLRNLSHSLDTDLIRNIGWQKATEKLFLNLQKANTHKVTIETEDDLSNPGNEKSIILYRMIQEVFNNIVKHAEASEIRFKVIKEYNKILIMIQDNGKGFDKKIITRGAGLQNLENRARMIDAIFTISSKPEKGTDVSISINVKPDE